MEITLIILGVLFVGVGFLIFRAYRRMKNIKSIPESDQIKTLTDKNFNAQIKNGLVLVDFWAAWCMPCKLMIPVLNELAEEPENEVVIAKLNVDEARITATKFKVRSIPTCLLFKNGKEVERIVGVKSTDQISKQIKRHIS